MARESIKQTAFCEEYTDRLAGLETVDVVHLSGSDEAVPQERNCILGMAALSEFDKLPQADRFVRTFLRAPHAIIQLGRMTLLAVVDDQRVSKHVLPGSQRVISMNHDGCIEIIRALPDEFGIHHKLGRKWLNGKTKHNDAEIAKKHILLGPSGRDWIVQDLGSVSGTKIALESGSGYLADT